MLERAGGSSSLIIFGEQQVTMLTSGGLVSGHIKHGLIVENAAVSTGSIKILILD